MTITVEHENGNAVIHDLLLDRKFSVNLEQAYELEIAIGNMLQDLEVAAHPEKYPEAQ